MDSWYTVKDFEIDFCYNIQTVIQPIDAAKLAVESIMKNYQPPYIILVSGGVDSQAMLYSWKKFGDNFIPTCFVYNNGLNCHDIDNIKEFSKLHDIRINFKDIDVISFIDTEYDTYAKKYQCSSPWICTYIKMAEFFTDTVIFGGNFLTKKGATLTYSQLALHRVSKIRKNIIPYFFLHTPELAYSFVHFRQSIFGEYDDKVIQYTSNGFPVVAQQDKMTGFEKIKDLYDVKLKSKITAKDMFKYSRRLSQRPFDILYRYPYEEKFGDRDLKFLLSI